MSERGAKLLERANGQISEVIGLLSASGGAALMLPNAARGKLGDGTVGASALHVADAYPRIAGIVRASLANSSDLGRRGHSHPTGGYGHDDHTGGTVDLPYLLERLSAGRSALSFLADLTDDQLDSVPPAGSGRFCDGKRTLEQVVTGALDHQGRNVDALKTAVA